MIQTLIVTGLRCVLHMQWNMAILPVSFMLDLISFCLNWGTYGYAWIDPLNWLNFILAAGAATKLVRSAAARRAIVRGQSSYVPDSVDDVARISSRPDWLQVPAQTRPIPQAILDTADSVNVIIRDID